MVTRVIQRRAYSLMDVLVTISVVAVLITLMAPALSGIRETTRRVMCSSNSRQLGMGIAMFADAHNGMLPTSAAASSVGGTSGPMGASASAGIPWRAPMGPADSVTIRLAQGVNAWDGLGWTYAGEYLPNPAIFYCPSHKGEYPFTKFAQAFTVNQGEIIGNYQYRGPGPSGTSLLAMFPARTAMLADGMRTVSDVNHSIGANVLSGDMSVAWYSDETIGAFSALANSPVDSSADARVLAAWSAIDQQIAPYAAGRDSGRPTGRTPPMGPGSGSQQ